MTNVTINAAITYPQESIDTFADKLGYPVDVVNEDYVPQVGSPTINDPDHVPPEDYDEMTYEWPQIDNPDYVAAVGTPTIPNPESRTEFVKRMFKDQATKWFTQFAERDINRAKQAEAQEQIALVKTQVENAISI